MAEAKQNTAWRFRSGRRHGRPHQPPSSGLGRAGARRDHSARRQPDRLQRAARCQARSHQGAALHDVGGHAQSLALDRRADRRARLLLEETRRGRAQLRQDVRAGANAARAVPGHRPRQAADHLPRSGGVLRRGGPRGGRRPQGHPPQPGRRDGLLRHRRHQFHRHRVRACPSYRPIASAFSSTT